LDGAGFYLTRFCRNVFPIPALVFAVMRNGFCGGGNNSIEIRGPLW